MRLKFLLFLPITLCLSSCATAIPVVIGVASWAASINNVGASLIKLKDDQLNCQVTPNPITDPNIITIAPVISK